MTPEFLFTIAMSVLTIVGSIYGTRYALQKGNDDAKAAAVGALERVAALEDVVSTLRAKVDESAVRVARQEVLQERHGLELQQGMARIEAAVVSLHARLDRALNRNSRGDE